MKPLKVDSTFSGGADFATERGDSYLFFQETQKGMDVFSVFPSGADGFSLVSRPLRPSLPVPPSAGDVFGRPASQHAVCGTQGCGALVEPDVPRWRRLPRRGCG